MATIKKPTHRENYATLLNIAEVKANPTLVEFLNGRIEALDKKATASKGKQTAEQKANAGIKGTLLTVLRTHNDKIGITALIKTYPTELGEFSNQKLSALLRQMIAEGTVERVEEKGKAYFKALPLADTDEE